MYLRQPYPFFLGRNSAELSKTVLSEVDQVIANVLLPAAVVVAYSLVVLLIVVVLVMVEPLLAFTAGIILLVLYAAIFFATRRILQTAGAGRVEANRQRFIAANESLGGIKEIKLLGAEAAYLGTFQDASMRFSKHQVTNLVIADRLDSSSRRSAWAESCYWPCTCWRHAVLWERYSRCWVFILSPDIAYCLQCSESTAA